MKKTEKYRQLVFNTNCTEEERMRAVCEYAESEITKIYMDFTKAFHDLYGSTVLRICQVEQEWMKEMREQYFDNCNPLFTEEDIPMKRRRN